MKAGWPGLVTAKDILKTTLFPNACKDGEGRLRVAAAVGVRPESVDRARLLMEAGVDALVVDSAHGHSENVIQMVKRCGASFPAVDLVAGNVVTAEGCAGTGGCGSGCGKSRRRAGFNLHDARRGGCGSAADHRDPRCLCARLKKRKCPVIADGGIRYSATSPKRSLSGRPP